MITYEWDDRKNTANERKHGVGFFEATTVFDDPLAVSVPDAEHSVDEERWITIGTSSRARLIVVVHVRKLSHVADEVIRLVSARMATGRERKVYTEG